MLYTINNSPHTSNSLDSLLHFAPAGEPILLYEDGVYAAADDAKTSSTAKDALKNHTVYAIDADIEARGVKKVIEGIKIISYDGFVELVEKHDVVPWL